jgi:hypothetical protein
VKTDKRMALLHSVAFANAQELMQALGVPPEVRASVFFGAYARIRGAIQEFCVLDGQRRRRLPPSRN